MGNWVERNPGMALAVVAALTVAVHTLDYWTLWNGQLHALKPMPVAERPRVLCATMVLVNTPYTYRECVATRKDGRTAWKTESM